MNKQEHSAFDFDERLLVTVSTDEVKELIDQIANQWDSQTVSTLLDGCKHSVINSIVGPFGLGKVISSLDKDGGNITTVHNAKQGIYAQDEDRFKRSDYAGSKYVNSRDEYKKSHTIDGKIRDEYSGQMIDAKIADCDHIKSAKSYHDEGGFMQSKEKRADFGSDKDNFATTHQSANRSKGDSDIHEWQSKNNTGGSNNKEHYDLDGRRVNPAAARGEKTAEKHAPDTIDKATYYAQKSLSTGVNEAAKMGTQQAIGTLLSEFISIAFDEVTDFYKNEHHSGMSIKQILESLNKRLINAKERVLAAGKSALIAFKDGAISGFLSNLVTMLINQIATTLKNMVRIIREGLFTLLKAIKTALYPTPGMTKNEAYDAGLKLLGAGVITALGIAAEEVVSKTVTSFLSTTIPILAPFGSQISIVIVGALTGIASALVVYGLDKMDLFGVNRQKRHEYIISSLDKQIEEADCRIQKMVSDVENPFDDFLASLR